MVDHDLLSLVPPFFNGLNGQIVWGGSEWGSCLSGTDLNSCHAMEVDILLSPRRSRFFPKQYQAAPATTYTTSTPWFTVGGFWGELDLENFCQFLLPYLPYIGYIFHLCQPHPWELHSLPLLYQGFPRCHHPALVTSHNVETLDTGQARSVFWEIPLEPFKIPSTPTKNPHILSLISRVSDIMFPYILYVVSLWCWNISTNTSPN